MKNTCTLFSGAALGLALFLAPGCLSAQCPFDPKVEGDTILCPGGNGLLTTQNGYDSLQWYKRAWGAGTAQPIAGATGTNLPINEADDLLYYFSVEASLGGCTERSPEVLVDGWMFLLPTVATTGSFTVGPNGETLVCEGDTVYFELMQPYTENIVWTLDGMPIAGANGNVLTVTLPGIYTVSGAPTVCPDYIQPLGVDLEVQIIQCPVGVEEAEKDSIADLFVFPNPGSEHLTLAAAPLPSEQTLYAMDILGRVVFQTQWQGQTLSVETATWAPGSYILLCPGFKPMRWTKR